MSTQQVKGGSMKKVVGIFFLVGLGFLLGGCGSVTVPPVDVMQKELVDYKLPQLPTDETAVVYVVRPSSGAPAVSFDIYVDSQEKKDMIGYNDTEEYLYASLTLGQHTIYSKAENWAEMQVEAKPNQLIFIEQSPKIGILFARNELKKLDELTGKYHVKHLKLGTWKKE